MPPTGLAFWTTTMSASGLPADVLVVLELFLLPPDCAMTKATTRTTRARPSRPNRWLRDKVFPPGGCSVDWISRAPEARDRPGGERGPGEAVAQVVREAIDAPGPSSPARRSVRPVV